MSLTLNSGSPRYPREVVSRMALKSTNENPIEFASGALRSERVTREFPIARLECFITGQLVVSSTVSSVADVWDLIDQIEVKRNGNEPVVSVWGYELPYLHRVQFGHTPRQVQPGTGVATHDFFAHFTLPMDVGGYNSLLDASGDQSLDVSVKWGTLADLASGGASTLQNVQLEVKPMVVTGGLAGTLGGKEGGELRYLRNYMIGQRKDVTNVTDDFRFELVSGRGYHGLTLFARTTNGVLADTIINEVTIERADSRHVHFTADQIRALNQSRYQLGASSWVGVYEIPFVDSGHPEHTLSIDNRQQMQVILDVSNPGTDQVDLVSHYFRS